MSETKPARLAGSVFPVAAAWKISHGLENPNARPKSEPEPLSMACVLAHNAAAAGSCGGGGITRANSGTSTSRAASKSVAAYPTSVAAAKPATLTVKVGRMMSGTLPFWEILTAISVGSR